MTSHAHPAHSQHDQHPGNTGSDHTHGREDEAGLAEVLTLDALALGSYLDDMTAWVGSHTPQSPRRIVDVGAGTGTGSLALAQRFPDAEIVPVDLSPEMLGRILTAATERGIAKRIHPAQADLDVAWPDVAAIDLAWAASSLHHFAEVDRVLHDIHGAVNPGGLFVAIEMDGFPRFLPDDIGVGRPGLEARIHAAIDALGHNAHPDWAPQIAAAGFEMVEQRVFTIDLEPAPPEAARYARALLSRFRVSAGATLDAEDLATLDELLDDENPVSIMRRGDLSVRNSRTAWLARRP